VSITRAEGCLAEFEIEATGTGQITYQWRKNGIAIAGATNARYSFSTTASREGDYDVVVTNSCNSIASSEVSLTVSNPLTSGSHNTQSITSCLGVNPVELNFSSANGYTAPSGGSLPYTFQWKLNGSDIPGATDEFYDPGAPAATGTYSYNVE